MTHGQCRNMSLFSFDVCKSKTYVRSLQICTILSSEMSGQYVDNRGKANLSDKRSVDRNNSEWGVSTNQMRVKLWFGPAS